MRVLYIKTSFSYPSTALTVAVISALRADETITRAAVTEAITFATAISVDLSGGVVRAVLGCPVGVCVTLGLRVPLLLLLRLQLLAILL